MGTAVAQWLRRCATNQKVAGSIPASVIGFFIDIKSFRSHYGPGVDSASNTRVPGAFPGGKGARCIGLTTYQHPVPLSRNLGTLTSWNPLGHSEPVTGLLYLFRTQHFPHSTYLHIYIYIDSDCTSRKLQYTFIGKIINRERMDLYCDNRTRRIIHCVGRMQGY